MAFRDNLAKFRKLVGVFLCEPGTVLVVGRFDCGLRNAFSRRMSMGRGILLWLLGVPIPIIILLALFWH